MALYASRYFEEVHMGVLIEMFDAGDRVAVVVLAVMAAYVGYYIIYGIRAYFRFRGARLVTCVAAHRVLYLAGRFILQ